MLSPPKYILEYILAIFISAFLLLPSPSAKAQVILGPADAGRLKPEERRLPATRAPSQQIAPPSIVPASPPPPGARAATFTLQRVQLDGATAFTTQQMEDIYAPYMGHTTTLDTIYMIADAITERYRSAGYFLSLAYVPDQRIKDGNVTIRVVEGFVGKVDMEGTEINSDVVNLYIARLLGQRPLKAAELESFLLYLNDLPGLSFRAVLASQESEPEGEVKLTLILEKKHAASSITYDNYGSRFLGPNEVSTFFTSSLASLQQTSISLLTALPLSELMYIGLTHSIAATPAMTFDLIGSFTKAHPRHTLTLLDIDTRSTYLGAKISYQWIRQRDENLEISATLDGKNTYSTSLGIPMTDDRIRVLRLAAAYDIEDRWQGSNFMSCAVSRGLSFFNSSAAGDLNLSRAEAAPDFSKLEISFSRLQRITHDWSFMTSAMGQRASGPLYSSEEFGYGGQVFGRAYDSSEITGDHGIAVSIETRYNGWSGEEKKIKVMPYAFYDLGKVWNDDAGQVAKASASSAGFGFRAANKTGISGNFAVAWPLIRDTAFPIYGNSGKAPRIVFQISQKF